LAHKGTCGVPQPACVQALLTAKRSNHLTLTRTAVPLAPVCICQNGGVGEGKRRRGGERACECVWQRELSNSDPRSCAIRTYVYTRQCESG